MNWNFIYGTVLFVFCLMLALTITTAQTTANNNVGVNVTNKLDNHTIKYCEIELPIEHGYRFEQIDTRNKLANVTIWSWFANKSCIQGLGIHEVVYNDTTRENIRIKTREVFMYYYDLNETKKDRPNLGSGRFEQ